MMVHCIYCGDLVTGRLISGAYCSDICKRIHDREFPPVDLNEELPF